MEFGVRWGQNINLFQSLRQIYEPFNYSRKIIGFELIQGDASVELAKYLKYHPETIISLAYFDFDIYEPTKNCLELIKPHLTKGSILVFDELNQPKFPGETIALREVFGLDKYSIKRSPFSHYQSYVVIE